MLGAVEVGLCDTSAIVGLPEMRLLGYQPTRPRLRLLSLPDETIEPSPVPLNGAMCALDRGFLRDGWIVFNPNEEVWGVPVPLAGKAFRVGRWWDCAPALNPRTVWLGGPIDPDPNVGRDRHAPTVLTEYDGVAREAVGSLELRPGLRLVAAVHEGLVMVDGRGTLILVGPGSSHSTPLGHARRVLAQHQSLLAVIGIGPERELTLLDVASRTRTAVRRPFPGLWGMFASFSPDGRTLAIDIEEEVKSVDAREAAARLGEPRWTRMALVQAESGAVTVVDGRFDNFATAPVWSRDSSVVVFDAPFDKSMFACQLGDPSPSLLPVVRRRGRPGPLVDVTAITA